MVRAGEKGGILEEILVRLADFATKSERIRRQVREALTYPTVVMSFAVLVLSFVMIVIVPKFEEIFKNFNAELPALTQALIATSRGMAKYWYVLLAVPVVLVIVFRLLTRLPRFRFGVDKLKLRLPLFGDLIQKSIIARFSRTLGTLLQSGVPILEALEIVEASIENTVLSKAVGDVRASVREGETMAAPLMESRVFDDLVVNMIDVGEATGSVDRMLLRIADTYEEEVDGRVSTLFKVLEPLLLLVLAGVIGFIVVALFLPIVKVMDTLSSRG
jgi:type IV pilus assembly protein PilC